MDNLSNKAIEASSNLNMDIEAFTDLGKDAIENPKSYNGFMGISIQHMFFSKNNMEYYFRWASQIFNTFVIILMDDPDMHNFALFKNIPMEAGLVLARKISDELKLGYERKLLALGIDNISVRTFRDFKEDQRFISILEIIEKHANQNQYFRTCLVSMMDGSIGGKILEYTNEHNVSEEEVSHIKQRLLSYLVEELSSILYFTEIGYKIEVDPTIEFSLKTLLYSGEFPEIASELSLTRRGHINVHPKGIFKKKIVKAGDSKVNDVKP